MTLVVGVVCFSIRFCFFILYFTAWTPGRVVTSTTDLYSVTENFHSNSQMTRVSIGVTRVPTAEVSHRGQRSTCSTRGSPGVVLWQWMTEATAAVKL